MELYLLRHGESAKSTRHGRGSNGGVRNPGLTEDGKKEITRIAKSIRRFKITFDTILTSPLDSATQTAKIISSTFKMKGNIINCNELLPEGNNQELYNRLQHYESESSILLVGHEPYLTHIIDDIISNQRRKVSSRRSVNRRIMKETSTTERSIVVKKGGLAKIRIISTTPKLRGELRWLLTPRIIKSIFEDPSTVETARQKKENHTIEKVL
ncbi:MAG TPA: histidine phosphatase family protein [Nitrososphaeraceae archaeon]